MKYLKVIFEQALLITVGITFAISIEGLIEHLRGEDICFSWYVPASAIIGGVLCSLTSTFLLLNAFEKKKREIQIRIITHCILTYGVNMLIGWLFKWYTQLDGFIFVSVSYFAVYIFAWVGYFILNRQEDREINAALSDIRDDE